MPQKVVSQELASAINTLHEQLTKEFGRDFAYSIMGRGFKLAASNVEDGRIKPITETQRRDLERRLDEISNGDPRFQE